MPVSLLLTAEIAGEVWDLVRQGGSGAVILVLLYVIRELHTINMKLNADLRANLEEQSKAAREALPNAVADARRVEQEHTTSTLALSEKIHEKHAADTAERAGLHARDVHALREEFTRKTDELMEKQGRALESVQIARTREIEGLTRAVEGLRHLLQTISSRIRNPPP